MRGCVSFQMKVQILAFYTDLCTGHYRSLSGVYITNLLNDLDFYLGLILSHYEAKYLGKYLTRIFSFIKGQYLAQIKSKLLNKLDV